MKVIQKQSKTTTKGGNCDALHLETSQHHASHAGLYDAYNALAYTFNNFTAFTDS